jgi:hypothetical protein
VSRTYVSRTLAYVRTFSVRRQGALEEQSRTMFLLVRFAPNIQKLRYNVKITCCVYLTGPFQKWRIDLNPVKSLVQHHQTRMTLSFPTVLSAPPSESEKCPFNNVNCSHLTAHSTQLWS